MKINKEHFVTCNLEENKEILVLAILDLKNVKCSICSVNIFPLEKKIFNEKWDLVLENNSVFECKGCKSKYKYVNKYGYSIYVSKS